MNIQDKKILIIGAGPTGLTAALQFIHNGVKVDIVEKRDSPSTLSRAVGIMPGSLEKLGANVSKRILAESMPFMSINMHIENKRVLNLNFKGRLDPKEVLTGLPQDRTEEIIRDELRALGVQVRYACAVTKISTSDDKVAVSFNDESEEYEYDWAIACDGANSMVRKQLGIAFPGYDLDRKWSIADVELENLGQFNSNNVWTKIGADCDTLVSLPIGKKRIRIISTNENCLEILPVPIEIEKINRKGVFQISIRQAETYKKGRVLLAGDAAHCHSPVGGRGMNLGIADAYDAVYSILNGTTEAYTSKRHQEGAEVIKQSESVRKMIMSKSLFSRLQMRFILGTVNRWKWLQSVAIKRISKL